jgi:hypothetical protein
VKDPYALGFEIVETPDKNITMAHSSPEEQAFQRDLMIASRKAGSPCIHGRTFEAKEHPKGSAERAILNVNPITSDAKSDKPFVIIRDGAEPEYFGRWALANRRLGDLIRPIMPERMPVPFGGGIPPVPGDPDEAITTGEFAGKTLGEAHAEHFDPKVSDEEFLEKRRAALAASEINPDWLVGERDQASRDKPLEEAIAAEAKARGITIPEGKMIVSHVTGR